MQIRMALLASASPSLGETYDCHFPKAGHVVIDTREPEASITVNGKRHPASHGSYFFQAEDEDSVVVMFSPDMKRWDYGVDGERATRCTARPNRK